VFRQRLAGLLGLGLSSARMLRSSVSTAGVVLACALVGCNVLLGNEAPSDGGSGTGSSPSVGGAPPASGGAVGSGGALSSGGTTADSGGGPGSGGASPGSGGSSGTGGASATCEPACPSDQGCLDGSCVPILPECMGQTAGTAVCSADKTQAFLCGNGLVEPVDPETCTNFCRDGACVLPPSCDELPETCGPYGDDSCCQSPLVAGGEFGRTSGAGFPATVGDFRLDKYEVTVGRFRKFVTAVSGGWFPTAGSGKHVHLNGGGGLVGSTGSEFEPGWDTAWNLGDDDHGLYSGTDAAANWNMALGCGSDGFDTWTASADLNESLPISCVNWYQAAAFCIWDEGFLPSESEWEYAAAGGALDRDYPWGSQDPAPERAAYHCIADGSAANDCSFEDLLPVGTLPDGDGFYLQSDLVGNMWEWVLDWFVAPYDPATCENCTNTAGPLTTRSMRGNGLLSLPEDLTVDYRAAREPWTRDEYIGLRCARVP